jgi:hypothetical protein
LRSRISIEIFPSSESVAMTASGSRISTLALAWMSPAFTVRGPTAFSISVSACSLWQRNGICLRFKMMSVVSSTTPGTDENSCSTPSSLIAVIEAPLDRREQDPSQRISDRGPEAPLERLGREPAELRGQGLALDFEPLRPLKSLPEHIHLHGATAPHRTYFE